MGNQSGFSLKLSKSSSTFPLTNVSECEISPKQVFKPALGSNHGHISCLNLYYLIVVQVRNFNNPHNLGRTVDRNVNPAGWGRNFFVCYLSLTEDAADGPHASPGNQRTLTTEKALCY
jgi:hypothetical protein